jgi:hypothetical protein
MDHIIVSAFSLEVGADFIRKSLGVSPQPGGEHPRMATHNLLLRLGDSIFLEIIAPNPVSSLKIDAPITVKSSQPGKKPHLAAYINTPQGLRILISAR